MAAPKGNKFAKGNKGGRPTAYRPEFAEQARRLCQLGAIDTELADFFSVTVQTIHNWRGAHQEFFEATRVGKEYADDRVERSFYKRAVGPWFVCRRCERRVAARGGAANIRDIAAAFLARDESQLEYYEQITKDMPGKAFAKHGIVKRDAALVRAPCVIIRTVINGFTFDGATKDPMQQAVRDALIAFMAAMSQAQAGATKAAQRAGIERAKQNDEQSVSHVSEPCPSWRPVNGPSPGGK